MKREREIPNVEAKMKHTRWLYWLKFIAGIALIAVLYKEINRRESIIEAFRTTKWSNILICALLLIPNIWLAFLKWRYLLKHRFSNTTNREALGSLLFGYTLGLVTPGRLGELARGLFFTDKDRLAVTGLNLLDKAANQVVIFTAGGISLELMALNGSEWQIEMILPFLYLAGGMMLVSWCILLNPEIARRWLRKVSEKISPRFRFPALIAAFDRITRKDMLVVLGLTLVWYAVIVWQYHILALAFTGVSFAESFQAVTAMLLVKTLLPFTFGDLGIRESVSVFFYSQFDVSPAAVFNAALLVFLINFLIPALSGLYFVFKVTESPTIPLGATFFTQVGERGLRRWKCLKKLTPRPSLEKRGESKPPSLSKRRGLGG
jgi:uncharacterized membrane protein YbhN (UPF0104 family)